MKIAKKLLKDFKELVATPQSTFVTPDYLNLDINILEDLKSIYDDLLDSDNKYLNIKEGSYNEVRALLDDIEDAIDELENIHDDTLVAFEHIMASVDESLI